MMTTRTTDVVPDSGNPEIAFIDKSISDYQTLLDGLRDGVDAVLIDGAHDGVAQIALALAGRSGIEAVHLLTHGAPGVLQLGATRLDQAGLAEHETDLGVLRSALADGADLLLYGCDVAAGAVGESFLQALSAATGADVAASINPSGSALLGGDWELEANTGNIETDSALTGSGQASFAGVLGITSEDFDSLGLITVSGTTMTAGDWTFTSDVPTDMAVANSDEFATYLNIDENNPNDRTVALNYQQIPGPLEYRMKSSDGTNFNLGSFSIGQNPESMSTVTIVAYSNHGLAVPGVSINLASSSSNGGIAYSMAANDLNGRYGTLTFGSAYANIDEIRFIFSNTANLILDNITVSPAVTDVTPPGINAVLVPANDTYAIGETLLFTVTFDEDVVVTGMDSILALDIGGAARNATFQSAPADRTIVYSYTVQSGDLDANGITINGLSLGTSTIRDAAGNSADLTLNNVGATAGVRVDGVAPAITGTITPPGNGTYAVGSNLDFTVTFDENVTVTGTSSTLELTVGTTPVFATHLSQTANSITYRYVVQAGNLDADGIAIRGLTLPNGNTIRDAAGNNADVSLAGHLPSLAGVRVDAVAPAVLGNITAPTADSYRAGDTLSFTVTFNESVDVTGTDSALGLDIGGAARNAIYDSKTADSITYVYTVQAGDNDANGITVGAITLGTTTIRDAAGNNAVLSLTGHLPSTAAVLVDTTAPAVSGNVAVPANATYVAGQQLDFTVTFDENVTVSGSDSTLGLTVGSTARSAVFLSASGNSITYRYIVQAGDLDANGIEVGAIALGFSTVRDAAGNDANLSLSGHLPSTSGVLVDGILPAVSGTISVPADGLYSVGQVLAFTITFDENVIVTGTASTLGLNIGGAARSAIYDSKTANSITYSYTVQAGDNDADGIAVTGLALNGGTIRDAAGNNANLALGGHVPSLAGVLVDGVPPSVAGNIAVPAADSYRAGEVLSFTITFDENVTVTGADSTLGLDIGGAARSATFLSSSANSITYTYTVQAGDNDANGITVGAITLGTTTIRDAAGNAAVLSLTGHLPSTAAILVDTTAPVVAGTVTVPLPGTYVAGQILDFVVSFDENITVTGNGSTLGLTIGTAARDAAFASADGNTVTYRYIVQAGDQDANGIDVGAITLGSSTIRDAAGNDAVIELAGHVPPTSAILVDGTAPVVSGTIGAPADKTYTVGETLTFTVTFNENVTVTGSTSTLGLDIGGAARSAVYESKTANSITYTYLVQAGDNDADGISITGLALNGGTIRDAAGNNADLALAGHLPSLAGVLVDTTAPSVAGNIAVPTADSYRAGETLSFTITFDENVTVTGADSTLGLDIGGAARSASFLSSSANSITYTYTVQTGDNDADGIAVTGLALNGGAIRDEAGNDAVLSLDGHLPSLAGVLVDGVLPAVSGTISVPGDGMYSIGQVLAFTITFDENVTVTGADSTLGLDIGGAARNAIYDSKTANSITYTYTVQAGDLDANGIGVGAIALGSSTIRDAAGNNANLSLSGHLPPTGGVLVDGVLPAVSGTISVPGDGLYSVGQVLAFTITFDEDVTVTGADSTFGLDVGGAARSAVYDSKTANSITYTYTVQAGDNDADGIAVTGLALNGSTIRDASGNDAVLSLDGHLPSLAGVLVDTTAPSVAGNIAVPANATYVAGQQLDFTVTFDENITVSGSDSTLGLTVGSTARSAVFLSADGNSITYRYIVQSGDLDANGITVGVIALGSSTVRDAAGNDAVLSLSGHLPPTSGVLVDGILPAVSGTISVPGDGLYSVGQVLAFTITFDENVTVTGADSTLGLDIGGAARNAIYDSKTANSITYTYTVQAGDLDANGIGVGAIALGSSTIRDAAGNNANLSLSGHLPPTGGVLVDGVLPAVSGTISVPGDGLYSVGQVLAFTITFDEDVTVTGADSTLGLDIGGAARSATFLSSSANSITYTYTVQVGDNDANGITVGAIVLGATTIRDAAGNDAVLSLSGHLPSTAAILVDTTAPAVSGDVAVPANATYVAGQQLDFTVTFDENITVTGSDSALGLTVGSTARSAVFLSADGNSITYRYIVQTGDNDADGITVGAITLGATTIRDAAGNDAVLSLSGHLPSTAAILVDTTAPAVAGNVTVPANATYVAGHQLDFTVTFDENVTVSGSDSTLGLTVGSTERSAVFLSADGTSITYRYIVQAGDLDADGIAVTGLALNGGTIRDAAGNDADLALDGHLPSLAGVLVDAVAPSVAGNITVPAADSYRAGETLNFTITFDENVTVTGTASTLGLDIGGAARSAVYDSQTANSITYRYIVQAGDNDADGIAVTGLTLNGGTIRDAAGNDAVLSLDGHLPSLAGVLVDTTAPSVAGNIAVPTADSYRAGETLSFTITFDENVTVTGADSTLGLDIGGAARSATFLSSSANAIIYTYTVQAGDNDANGITVGAIALGATTIRDVAGNDAVLSLDGHLPSTAAILVDTTAPAVAGNVTVPANATYVAGQQLDFTVTFDENVSVTGSDSTLGLTVGSTERSAVFLSADGTSITYRYIVQAGDNDADGITVGAIALGATTIRDMAGNDADLALDGHLPALDAVRVDTAGPVLTTARVNGNSMVLSFADAGALDAAHPPVPDDFAVTVAGQPIAVTGVTVDASAKTVTLTLSSAVRNGQAVTVAYDDLTPNDDNAIQDALGNDAASFGMTPVVNNTPVPPTNPPTNPPTTGYTVDGVTVQIGTVVRSDGTVAQVITVPIVTPSRQEQVGNNNVADIPLVKAAGGSSLLTVQVPIGAGLQSIGLGAPKRAGDSLTDLTREIQAHTTSGSHDQNQLIGGGGGFLDILDANTPLLVQTIVLSGTGGSADVPLGIIGQPQQAGSVQSALIIDARSLSSSATIELQHVSFAAIIGAATVTGGAGNQHVWGDGSSQTIILGEGDDVLHGGAGDDILGGGAGDDRIYGDEGDDLIFGGEGNDYLDGGAGHDTARFSGAVDGYSLRVKDGLLVMTDRMGNDGIDTVAAVEVLRFTGGQSMADDAVLTRLYEGVLGRQASAAEIAWWQDVHVRGASLQDIAAAIIDSPEAAQALGHADDDAFVAGLYQSVLGRTALAAERAFWTGQLADGVERAAVALGFVNSPERLASSLDVDFNRSDVAVLARMYHALFGRAPDEVGLNYWLERHEDGVSLGDIADAFIVSTEAQGLAGDDSDAAFIDHLFATALGRTPSSGEKTLLLEQLQNGVYDRGLVLLDVAESEESIAIIGVINTSIDVL